MWTGKRGPGSCNDSICGAKRFQARLFRLVRSLGRVVEILLRASEFQLCASKQLRQFALELQSAIPQPKLVFATQHRGSKAVDIQRHTIGASGAVGFPELHGQSAVRHSCSVDTKASRLGLTENRGVD